MYPFRQSSRCFKRIYVAALFILAFTCWCGQAFGQPRFGLQRITEIFLPEIRKESDLYLDEKGKFYDTRKDIDDLDIYTGKCTTYDKRKRKYASGKLKNGKFNGEVKKWKYGELREKAYWKNGELDGEVVRYYEGKLRKKSHWKSGKLVGLCCTYHFLSSQPYYEARLTNDGNLLSLKVYNRNGTLRRNIDYVAKTFIEYYKNGKTEMKGFYDHNAERDSLWINYDSLGNIENESKYRRGHLHGMSRFYLSNGFYYMTRYYEYGNKIGETYNAYYPNGQIVYTNDSLTGAITWYYQDGKPMIRGWSNRNLEKDSVWAYYHADGTKYYEERYRAGIQEGCSRSFNKAGNKMAETLYKQDKPVMMRTYYESGSIKSRRDLVEKEMETYYPDGKLSGKLIDGYPYVEFVYYDRNGKPYKRVKQNFEDYEDN